MKVCGLTGGVGMGKSTAAVHLRERGVPVVDADELARQLVQPGQPVLDQIRAAFGQEVFTPAGELNRAKLAQIIFADAGARRRLEAILHPPIRERWLAQIEIWRHENHPLAIVVIPLLFESKAESHFGKIICVACSAVTQRERLRDRGWTPGQIQQRMAAQWPVEQKISRSDFVIWTEGSPEVTVRQMESILTGL